VLTHRTLIRNILGRPPNCRRVTSRRSCRSAAKKTPPNSCDKVAETKIILEITSLLRNKGPYLLQLWYTRAVRTHAKRVTEAYSAYGQTNHPVIIVLQLRGSRLCEFKLTEWTVSSGRITSLDPARQCGVKAETTHVMPALESYLRTTKHTQCLLARHLESRSVSRHPAGPDAT